MVNLISFSSQCCIEMFHQLLQVHGAQQLEWCLDTGKYKDDYDKRFHVPHRNFPTVIHGRGCLEHL